VTSPWQLAVRVLIGVIGMIAVVGGLAFLLPSFGFPGLWVALMGGVLVVAAVFEVGRYRANAGATASADASRFQRTDEVFVDPTTGVTMRVWFDARSGERRYEPEH
jgi:hypothetical protein